MHTEVFNNIDTLISMANSSLNIDDINNELISLNKSIKDKRGELEDLKSLMNDNRYFNASSELVDKNIEISLKNKINRLNYKLKDITTTLDNIKEEEKNIHEDIAFLTNKLTLNTDYVNALETKVNETSKNDYYKTILDQELANINSLNNELESKSALYNEILKNLEINTQAYEEINNSLKTEEARLKDVLDNLASPTAYIDEDLKKSDEHKLANLTQELKELETRRVELLTSPSMIGADAKELILKSDITKALNKVKELVNIVKQKPFMDISSSTVLEEELQIREAKREELSNLIDNKTYLKKNNDIITKRIDYLNESINNNNNLLNEFENNIKSTDEYVNNTLAPLITEVEQVILSTEQELTKYRSLANEETKPAHLKSNFLNIIEKKEKERNILHDILTSYKENLIFKINTTTDLNNLINKINSENTSLNNELTELKKLANLDLEAKDLIALEKDKDELKKLNEEIKALKNRQKYPKTPDEIYDEIDMSLITLKPKEETPSRLKVVEVIPLENLQDKVGDN